MGKSKVDDTLVIMTGDLPDLLAKDLGRPIRTLRDLKECKTKGFIQDCPGFLEALSKAIKEERDD
mgnify:CR=1 FL=1|jgi:hypothetical protein